MKIVWVFLCILVFLGGGWSCERNSAYPDIPEIHFKKLSMKTDGEDDLGNLMKTVTLTFSFVDGDGDLGVRYPSLKDTVSQVYVIWQTLLPDKTYQNYEFADRSVIQKFRISYSDIMNRDEAQNKVLKGTIDVKLSVPMGTPTDMDTVRLEYYIMDRAGHHSNTDYTPNFSILDRSFDL